MRMTISALNEHELAHRKADRLKHWMLARAKPVVGQREVRVGPTAQSGAGHRRGDRETKLLEWARPVITDEDERATAPPPTKAHCAIEHEFERRQANLGHGDHDIVQHAIRQPPRKNSDMCMQSGVISLPQNPCASFSTPAK